MTIKDLTRMKRHVLICNGGSCMQQGGEHITQRIRSTISECNLETEIHTTRTRCLGRCDDGPIVVVYPDGVWYKCVGEKAAKKIVKEHLLKERMVTDNVLYDTASNVLHDS